jgi:hypothetical protein
MDAGFAIRCGRTFEENELFVALGGLQRLLEQLLIAPTLQYFVLEVDR